MLFKTFWNYLIKFSARFKWRGGFYLKNGVARHQKNVQCPGQLKMEHEVEQGKVRGLASYA
jgi:hypothetical protein